MTAEPRKLYVTQDHIADLAGVGRSAVGNWRKRHADFPLPNASDRFDLDEVERWLIEKGKLTNRAPRDFIVWQLADLFRAHLSPAETTHFIVAALVYLDACSRGQTADAARVDIPANATWAFVRESHKDGLLDELLSAAESIERANPALDGLLTPGFSLASNVDASFIGTLLDVIEEVVDGEFVTYVSLFEDAMARAKQTDRFSGDSSTPDTLTELMARLGGKSSGTFFDPAVGEGGLLLTAALRAHLEGGDVDLLGYEINENVMRTSRARFFLYEVDATLAAENAFRVPVTALPQADLVLLDPPVGQTNWGDADLYLDPRWTYGVPPAKRADLAWLQLAASCLNADGRAVVVTSPAPVWSSGSEQLIRSALLADGRVVAVIALPPRLRPDTSIPLFLWVIRAKGETKQTSVLLVDAVQLGETSRSLYSFSEADLNRIVGVVEAYESDPSAPVEDDAIAWVVPIDDLDEANLDPARYRPVPEVDVDALRKQRAELRANLSAKTTSLGQAVVEVLSKFGGAAND